jgi:hypothetical protein
MFTGAELIRSKGPGGLEEPVMYLRHVVAFVAIVAVGFFALWWLFSSNPTADVEASSTMDIFNMHRQIKELPVRDVKDPI